MRKIAIVVGTRPEIIKMASLVKYCQAKKIDFFIVHTGQHYSYEMDAIFFKELELPSPKYSLAIKSSAAIRQGEHTGKMMEALEEVFLKEKPDVVLAEGDTNTVLAAALVSIKLYIKFGHVESGLRSFDKTMPEEINRVLADHMADFLFAPTETSRENIIRENISNKKIYVTGNSIVDIVFWALGKGKRDMPAELGLKKDCYFLVTAHRQENVDDREKIKNILKSLDLLYQKYKLPVVYPMHPRTRKMLSHFSAKVPSSIKVIEPLGYFEFLQLEANSRLNLTDSGGVQEESCIFKVPCITLRENTERPETIDCGANMLAGTDTKRILKCAEKMMNISRDWDNPFGDGKTGERIIEIIMRDKAPALAPRWVLEGLK